MTEQIIVNGVDVSGCECFSEDDEDICDKGLKQWLETECE